MDQTSICNTCKIKVQYIYFLEKNEKKKIIYIETGRKFGTWQAKENKKKKKRNTFVIICLLVSHFGLEFQAILKIMTVYVK